MGELISTDSCFTKQQQTYISVLLEQMIPATDEMPSAGEKKILSQIVRQLEAQSELVIAALVSFSGLLAAYSVSNFAELTMKDQADVLSTFLVGNDDFKQFLQGAAVMEYYRDDRVMLALGLEPRAPHPGGYSVPESNWTLLEPVRKMPDRYREV